ncbi:MAG TPA: GGDEF domain-containing protein [Steroidobacteraceae bacterium]|jgi:diguanylate cyclase (GGDEF)-like protein|nr:GGDEF domain-containing protein [Steroidobacteraceae bacterium]
MSGFELALLSLLAAAVAGVLARIVFLHARIARRARALESELARRREVEIELEGTYRDLQRRFVERTRALEERNEELTRLRFALETANRRLKHLVGVDALTGIANRRHFDRALEREIRRARRDAQPLSLVFLDLDQFKLFNDSYGHTRGDEVLRRVAQTLDETFRRGGDLVARYGGEEFAVVLPGVDGRRAGLYAERLRRRIWRLAIPYNASQLTDRVTISGGVATICPPATVDPDELLFAADKALYRAKCLGRNRIATAEVQTALADQASA